jgi:hypothetical protein
VGDREGRPYAERRGRRSLRAGWPWDGTEAVPYIEKWRMRMERNGAGCGWALGLLFVGAVLGWAVGCIVAVMG